MTASTTGISAAWDALAQVLDPETELSIVDMGLVYGVEETTSGLLVRLTLTHESCPMGGLIVEQAEEALAAVTASDFPARIELTFDPPWTPARINAEGRRQLGQAG
jgi:metal-sulfur cluster biosynthetic enzyme